MRYARKRVQLFGGPQKKKEKASSSGPGAGFSLSLSLSFKLGSKHYFLPGSSCALLFIFISKVGARCANLRYEEILKRIPHPPLCK
jgi:hypothetical protein